MKFLFNNRARWIWLPSAAREKNVYACFRREIELDAPCSEASIALTADARYELWINGTFVGHGPIRSWPSPWPVDEYAIGHLLRPGRNAIGVLVNHFGLSTFQYLHDQPGLIAEMRLAGQVIGSDSAWKCIEHEGYLWPVPRITCQQGWEEQFDARVAPGLPQEWSSPEFDDGSWTAARVLRKAEEGGHEQFELREIPMLTLEPIEPVAIRAIEAVRPACYSFALNPRELVNSSDKSANHIVARMLIATYIHSDQAQEIELHLPHTRPLLPWKLNGELLSFDDHSLQHTDTGVACGRLEAGGNLLIVRLPESEHHYWANINLWTARPVKFSTSPATISHDSGWLALGPFAGAPMKHRFDRVFVTAGHIDPRATAGAFERIWAGGALSPEDLSEPFVRPMPADMVAAHDVYAACVSDRVEPSQSPQIDQPIAMLDRNSDWTTIHPSASGADVRVLLDFGRELVGFQEFEIDVPPPLTGGAAGGEGAVIDWHNFEFVQRDGRINLCESMNNSFRYICRTGVQRYKSFLRRGLRYSWMTLRGLKAPVRVRFVGVLMSTYPQARAGSFQCSDEMLNRIWLAGAHTVRCCSEDTYTDCPTYEQTFWVGDARNEALVDLIANGDARLSAHCLRLVGRSLDRSPIVESQVPSGWQNLLPTWTFLWMRWAQEHYQLTGDEELAREMLGFVDRNIAGMRSAINARGLFEMFAWNLFDWAGMDTPPDGIVTHINCVAVLGLRQSAQLARALGDEAKFRSWNELADGIASAVNAHLWSAQKQAYVDCIRADGTMSPKFSQQTQTAAWISGVCDAYPDRKARARDLIHHPPADFIQAGSPFFMFFLLEALAIEEDYIALAETIRSYWGKQIAAGATTFWEMYQEQPADSQAPTLGAQATNKPAHRLTRSHCHGWSAAPTFFLTQYILGVRPMSPGYRSITIAPICPPGLSWAQGRVPTPAGGVQVYWKRADDMFDLTIDAPKGAELQIELPFTGQVRFIEGTGQVDQQPTHPAKILARGPRLRLLATAPATWKSETTPQADRT